MTQVRVGWWEGMRLRVRAFGLEVRCVLLHRHFTFTWVDTPGRRPDVCVARCACRRTVVFSSDWLGRFVSWPRRPRVEELKYEADRTQRAIRGEFAAGELGEEFKRRWLRTIHLRHEAGR